MICVSVTLGVDVPPRDRVEMQAAGAADNLFPIEDVTIDVDGVRQPKSHVEVSAKRDVGEGELTIVNKSRQTWVKGVTITACWPGPDVPPIGVGVIALLTGEAATVDFGQVDAIGESAEIGLAIGQQMDAAAGTVTVTAISNALVDVSSAALTALQGGLSVLAGGSVSVGVSGASLALTMGVPFIWARIPSLLTLTGEGMSTAAGTANVTAGITELAAVSGRSATTAAGTVLVTTSSVSGVTVAGQAMTAAAGNVTINATVGSVAVFYPATGLPAPVTHIAVSTAGYTAGVGYAVNTLSPHGTNPVGTCFAVNYWTSPATATKYLTAMVVSNYLFKATYYSRDHAFTGYVRNGEVFLRLVGGKAWVFAINVQTNSLSINLREGLAETISSPIGNTADATYFAWSGAINTLITAVFPTYSSNDTDGHEMRFEASGLDLVFWYSMDGTSFSEIVRLSAPEYATWLHMVPGTVAVANITAYGVRAFSIDYDDTPATFLSDFTTDLHMADLGVKAVSTTGTMSASSTSLTVASPTGFAIGDYIIVDTVGASGAGAKGSIGPGGQWPTLRYADATAMNADSSQAANTICSLSSTGYTYQYISSVWTQILTNEVNQLYIHKSLPLALRARITNIAGSVLTLDTAATVAVTASGVYHDNEPIIQQATANINYQVSVPELELVFPDSDVVIGEPLLIYAKPGWSFSGAGSGIDNSTPTGLTRFWGPRGCGSASMNITNYCDAARDMFFDCGGYVTFPQLATTAMSQTSTTVGSGYAFGFTVGSVRSGGVVDNIRCVQPWQKAVGLIDCDNVAVSNCVCEMVDPLLRYVQWQFQSSGSRGGNSYTDCEMTSNYLNTFCEPFQDGAVVGSFGGTTYTRCVARNGFSSNNSASNTTYTDLRCVIEANSRYSTISVAVGSPILQSNVNFAPGAPANAVITRFVYLLEGYVDANNEQPQGIQITGSHNTTVQDSVIQMLTYSATSTAEGAVGINCPSNDCTIDNVRVDGTTVNAFRGNIWAYTGTGTDIVDCIGDRLLNDQVGGTNTGGQTTGAAGTDRTPGAIAFTDVTGATPGQTYTSNEITISGVNALLQDVTLTSNARFIWNGSGLVRNHDHWMLKLLKDGDRIKLVAEAPATVTLQLASGHTTDWVLST